MCERTTGPRAPEKSTRSPCLSDHVTSKSSSLADANASRASRTFRSNKSTNVFVFSKLYPFDVARSISVPRIVCVSHPGHRGHELREMAERE